MRARQSLAILTLLAAASACDGFLAGPESYRQYGDCVVGTRCVFQLYGEQGGMIYLDSATCLDGCSLDPPKDRYSGQWLVAPLAPNYRVHLTGSSANGHVDFVWEGAAGQLEGKLATRGAGSGVAVLPGTLSMWGFETTLWDSSWSEVVATTSLEGPFEVVPPDEKHRFYSGDLFQHVVLVRAKAPGEGKLTYAVAGRSYEARLVAVDPAQVKEVALAPCDENAPAPSAEALKVASRSPVTLPLSSEQAFWSVFTTSDGKVGLGGGGDATPAALAPFAITSREYEIDAEGGSAFASRVRLSGRNAGASTLTLHVGAASGSVAVEVK